MTAILICEPRIEPRRMVLRAGHIIVGAHVVLKQHCTVEKHDEACRLKVEKLLQSRFKIGKSVLQIESHECQHVN